MRVVIDRTSSMTAGQVERVLVRALKTLTSRIMGKIPSATATDVERVYNEVDSIVATALEDVIGRRT